jgi:hypothetical protein
VPDFETDLERHILHQLLRRWQCINDECLDGRLTAPVFALDDAMRRLGRWDAATRTLGISRDHLRVATWLQVEQTLRHEMAHQTVSELFDARSAKPHGALFDRACTMLGLNESESVSLRSNPKSERALRRIQKLMQLATSSNEHEAQAAMVAANRLLLHHNLDLQQTHECSSFVYRWLGTISGRVSLERKLIARILSDHFFVQCIWVQSSMAMSKKRGRVLEILGQGHNVELAVYVHDFLEATLKKLSENFQKTMSSKRRNRSSGREYRIGVLMGFCEHLEAQKQSYQEQGLIWTGDPALQEFLATRYPRRRSMSSSIYQAGDAHSAGRNDGREIRIPGAIPQGKSDGRVQGLLR